MFGEDRKKEKTEETGQGRLLVRIRELHVDWRMPAAPRLFFLGAVLVGLALLYLWWPELVGYVLKINQLAST